MAFSIFFFFLLFQSILILFGLCCCFSCCFKFVLVLFCEHLYNSWQGGASQAVSLRAEPTHKENNSNQDSNTIGGPT